MIARQAGEEVVVTEVVGAVTGATGVEVAAPTVATTPPSQPCLQIVLVTLDLLFII